MWLFSLKLLNRKLIANTRFIQLASLFIGLAAFFGTTDRISHVFQGVLKRRSSPRLWGGSHKSAKRSPQGGSLTSSRTELCRSTRRESTTFTRGWSWSSETAPPPPPSTTWCLWGEGDGLQLWPWWRPTERVSAVSSPHTPGPLRATSPPPCSCRPTTEFMSTCRSPPLSVTGITPTSLVSIRSDCQKQLMMVFL